MGNGPGTIAIPGSEAQRSQSMRCCATLQSPKLGGLLANSLVYRYITIETADGLSGEEGTFNICTFWLVEALTGAGRFEPARLEDARLMFERMLGFANHVGLYAEEIGHCGESLGNFPQRSRIWRSSARRSISIAHSVPGLDLSAASPAIIEILHLARTSRRRSSPGTGAIRFRCPRWASGNGKWGISPWRKDLTR